MRLAIAELSLGKATLGICPSPGRAGFYDADFAALRHWHPDLVLTVTSAEELAQTAPTLAADLQQAGIDWLHFPIPDYSLPVAGWPALSKLLHARLKAGQRLLVHCMGGCGRSGTILLRLMVEAGEPPQTALTRLRAVRPCAVETDAQYAWASQP